MHRNVLPSVVCTKLLHFLHQCFSLGEYRFCKSQSYIIRQTSKFLNSSWSIKRKSICKWGNPYNPVPRKDNKYFKNLCPKPESKLYYTKKKTRRLMVVTNINRWRRQCDSLFFKQLWQDWVPVIASGCPSFNSEVIDICQVIVKTLH